MPGKTVTPQKFAYFLNRCEKGIFCEEFCKMGCLLFNAALHLDSVSRTCARRLRDSLNSCCGNAFMGCQPAGTAICSAHLASAQHCDAWHIQFDCQRSDGRSYKRLNTGLLNTRLRVLLCHLGNSRDREHCVFI